MAYAENQNQLDGSWSPDGKKILFGRIPLHTAEKLEINLVDLETHRLSTIPGSENLFSPRWSPKGERIAAMTEDARKLLLFDFKTQKWSNWVTSPVGIAFPAWSRDEHYLYYASNDASYRRVKVDQARSEFVADLRDLQRYHGLFGAWSGVTPDGSPLLVRDLSTDEI